MKILARSGGLDISSKNSISDIQASEYTATDILPLTVDGKKINVEVPNSVQVTTSYTDGGTGTGSGVYTKGDAVTLIAQPEDGHAFAGWKENGKIVSTSQTYSFVAKKNVSIQGVFDYGVVTVTFDSAGGSAVPIVKVLTGDTITEPAAPTKKGFKFAGWYAVGTKTPWNFNTPVTASMTLTAHWVSDGSGGSGGAGNSGGSDGSSNKKAQTKLSSLPLTGDASTIWQTGAILLLATSICSTAVLTLRDRQSWT